MEQLIIDQEQEQKLKKIYTLRAIWVGTFLGGPFTAGYLVSENFKAFGQTNKATATWAIAVIATVGILGSIFFLPDADKIPTRLIPLVYTAIVYYVVTSVQGDRIKEHLSKEGAAFSIWRSVVLALIGAIITIVPVIIYGFATDPVLTASNKTYGQLNHEIYFQPNTIKESEVDQVANALTQTGFFDEEQQKSILLKKEANKYIISVPMLERAWEQPEIVDYYEILRDGTQTFFKQNPVVINLCDESDITQVRKVVD